MDAIGWVIVNLHQLLGHDKAAVVLGVPTGDKTACLICAFERDPTAERRQGVVRALTPES